MNPKIPQATPDEIKRAEEMKNNKWDDPGIVVDETRWIDRMALIQITPDFGLKYGGDFMACVWRYIDDPETWILTYRTRINAGPNSSPWDMSGNGDRKRWGFARNNEGETTRREMVSFIEELPLRMSADFKTSPAEIDWLVIQGDSHKFFEVVAREKKPWMHTKMVKMPK